jgi:hypothetical protein
VVDGRVPEPPVILGARGVPPGAVELAIAKLQQFGQQIQERVEEGIKPNQPHHRRDQREFQLFLNIFLVVLKKKEQWHDEKGKDRTTRSKTFRACPSLRTSIELYSNGWMYWPIMTYMVMRQMISSMSRFRAYVHRFRVDARLCAG